MRIKFKDSGSLERKLYYPVIWHSDFISKRFKVRADIMDFSQCYFQSHKGIKARNALDYVEEKGGDIALAISSGNFSDALDLEAWNRDVQPVSFISGLKKPLEVEELGDGRYSVRLKLPDKWLSPKQLEKLWKKIIERKAGEYTKDRRFVSNYFKLIKVLEQKGLDYKNSFAVTNISDYSDEIPYYDSLKQELNDAVRGYDVIFVPIGIGELFRGFQIAKKRRKTSLVGVTSSANPFAFNCIFESEIKKKSDADKLDTLKPGKEHRIIRASADPKTYFSTIDNDYIDAGCGLYNTLVREEAREKGMKTKASLTSGITLGALMYACNSDNQRSLPCYFFREKPLEFWKKYPIKDNLKIKEGEKILIVNTGGK